MKHWFEANVLAMVAILAVGACDASEPTDEATTPGGKVDDVGSRVALDACEAAASAVVKCAGEVPDDFRSLCEDELDRSSGAAHDELIDELNAIVHAGARCQVPASQLWDEIAAGQGKSFGSKLFAFACTPVILAAGVINRARNSDIHHGPMPLPVESGLAPLFGAATEHAILYYDADLINEWTIGGKELTFGNVYAQTFGRRVYVTEPYVAKPYQDIVVGHEMVHVLQGDCFGGQPAFAFNYCEAFYKSGLSYYSNALEVAAYGLEAPIADCVYAAGECGSEPLSCEQVGAD